MPSTRTPMFPNHGALAAFLTATFLALPAIAGGESSPATAPIGDVKTPAPALPHKEPLPLRPALAAPIEAPKSPVDRSRAAPAVDRSIVRYATGDDGALWARGTNWKAGFDRTGASFVPCLGSSAPRNFPVAFHLASVSAGGTEVALDAAAEPSRAGDLVSFERGALVERYSLLPAGIEQSFVLDHPLGAGELVLRVGLETELKAEQRDESVELSNEHARVGYGRATAIDAGGRSIVCATLATAAGIEIRVPGSFLAGASYPLVVDPYIANVAYPNDLAIASQPDVAYVGSAHRYVIVHMEEFSQTDHDVFVQSISLTGLPISGTYVDVSTTNWADPAVAAIEGASQLLVVAEVGAVGSRTIQGKTVDAASLAVSTGFTISGNEVGEKVDPDVGGDMTGFSTDKYCVVWTRIFSATDRDVHAQLVRSDRTLLNASSILVDNTSSTEDWNPAISKSNGGLPSQLMDWTVGWQRRFSPSDDDVWSARIHLDGTISTPSFPVDQSLEDSSGIDVSSPLGHAGPVRECLLVWTGDAPAGDIADIHGAVVRGNTVVENVDLSELGGATPGMSQLTAGVDCDGYRFAVGYAEQYGPTLADYDIYAGTFTLVGSHLMSAEQHVQLFSPFTQDQHVAVVADRSGGGLPGRFLAAFESADAASGDSDIHGAIYGAGEFTSFCQPGVDAIACPCQNPPSLPGRGCDNSSGTGGAALGITGDPSIFGDTVVMQASFMKPTATCIFLQGSALANAVFGQGVRCTGGTLKRLYVKQAVGGAATAPGIADPSISARSAELGDPLSMGITRYYSVYYRDPFVLGGCTAAQTFNTTQTVGMIWKDF
jgi:hypothetical protein